MDSNTVLQELSNICKRSPVGPGEILARDSAIECVRRKWARLNSERYLEPTGEGLRVFAEQTRRTGECRREECEHWSAEESICDDEVEYIDPEHGDVCCRFREGAIEKEVLNESDGAFVIIEPTQPRRACEVEVEPFMVEGKEHG